MYIYIYIYIYLYIFPIYLLQYRKHFEIKKTDKTSQNGYLRQLNIFR